jgi:hypothetical protein
MKFYATLLFSFAVLCSTSLYADDAINEVARKLQSDLGESIITVKVVVDVDRRLRRQAR